MNAPVRSPLRLWFRAHGDHHNHRTAHRQGEARPVTPRRRPLEQQPRADTHEDWRIVAQQRGDGRGRSHHCCVVEREIQSEEHAAGERQQQAASIGSRDGGALAVRRRRRRRQRSPR
jgi:hypothetical protein